MYMPTSLKIRLVSIIELDQNLGKHVILIDFTNNLQTYIKDHTGK